MPESIRGTLDTFTLPVGASAGLWVDLNESDAVYYVGGAFAFKVDGQDVSYRDVRRWLADRTDTKPVGVRLFGVEGADADRIEFWTE